MKVKITNSEIGRMMRILSGCIDQRDQKNSNVEVSHRDNMFSIRAVNSSQFVTMSTPLLGGDGEKFCVDGKMFANIIGRTSGDVTIETDGQFCIVKSNGRTRIPLVDVELAEPFQFEGRVTSVKVSDLVDITERVRYASSQDDSRPILTGILTNAADGALTMVAVDGFQLAIEATECTGDDMNAVIPSIMLKRICDCAGPGETVKIVTDERHIRLSTDTVEVVGGALYGSFIDYANIIPQNFTTEVLFNVKELKDVLNASSVVGNMKNLVKFIIGQDHITVTSNSERADFEANIPCKTRGNEMSIAFNDKYVMNALSVLTGEEAVMNMNTPVSPAVFTDMPVENASNGTHLVLPVRLL